MTKKLAWILSLAFLLAAGAVVADSQKGNWTGKVVDLNDHQQSGVQAAAARTCVKNGQPMGLVTSDAGLVCLAKSEEHAAAYARLKTLIGERVAVSGSLAEKDGMKVVTVTGSKAAA